MKNVFAQLEIGYLAEKSLKDVNPFDRVYELINKPSPTDSLSIAFLAGQISCYLDLYITAFNAVKGNETYTEDELEAARNVAIENDIAIKAYFASLYTSAIADSI